MHQTKTCSKSENWGAKKNVLQHFFTDFEQVMS